MSLTVVARKERKDQMCISYHILNLQTTTSMPCFTLKVPSTACHNVNGFGIGATWLHWPQAFAWCRLWLVSQEINRAPAVFKRLTEKTVGDLKLLRILVHLQFFKPPVKYVGHSVWDRNRSKGSESSHTVEKAHLSSLRFLLGFCGYYSRFKASYSVIVQPPTK